MQNKYWIQFIQGNNEALAKVYEPYFQPLLFIALKYVKNTEIAQDITGEVFATLLETDIKSRKEKWSNINDEKAFLSTIIKCRAIDYIRIQQNRLRILSDNKLGIIYSHELESEQEHLSVCISQLTSEEQALLDLHLSGYNNHEIAENLHYSEKTVRNKLSVSRKKLIYLWKNLILLILWQI